MKEVEDLLYIVEYEFLEFLYVGEFDEEVIMECFDFFKDKLMYVDFEDFVLDVVKYYYERENFEKVFVYFLKVEEIR